MAKGYWVLHADVHDLDVLAQYREANAAAFARYNAGFLVRGGPQELREGELWSRTTVIEFPSCAAAVACCDSAAYQAAKAIRDTAATVDLVIAEGWVG